MLDLFYPPTIAPQSSRTVTLCTDDDPEELKRQQRLQALRKAWAARAKYGVPMVGATAEEKAAAKRERDAIRRDAARGSPRHEAIKAAKRNGYAAMTEEQRQARLAYQREWYARSKK
jgi:hypothetical protein